MKSIYPYGYQSFADDRDLLADAEAGRIILDNSRNSDGTYRRDNHGYFAEIAPMAGTLGVVPGGWGGWFSASPGTPGPYERPRYATPPVVGPEGPIVVSVPAAAPPEVSGRQPGYGPDPWGQSNLDRVRGTMTAGPGVMGMLATYGPWAVGGAALLVGAVMIFGRKKKARRRRR